jgi:hypothetical protein
MIQSCVPVNRKKAKGWATRPPPRTRKGAAIQKVKCGQKDAPSALQFSLESIVSCLVGLGVVNCAALISANKYQDWKK